MTSVWVIVVGSTTAVDGTRLAADVHEIVEHVLALHALDDLLPGAAAHEARGDHRLAERLEGAGDVDPFAARQRETLAGAMLEAGLEVGHRERLVDGGVGCDGDDHVGVPGAMFSAFAQKPAHYPRRPHPRRSIPPARGLDTVRAPGYVS